jgi:hypothetical protein
VRAESMKAYRACGGKMHSVRSDIAKCSLKCWMSGTQNGIPDNARGTWGKREKRRENEKLGFAFEILHFPCGFFKSISYSMDKIRQTFKHYYDLRCSRNAVDYHEER